MLVKLAWKNIGRNKLRSGVILTAITLGLFCGTFLSAFLNGWMISTVNDDINLQLSHIQIHHPSYEDNNDINAWFKREEAEQKIAGLPVESQSGFRLKLNAMLASANNSTGVTLKGVHPDEEIRTTTIARYIPDSLGAFFDNEQRMPVVISKKIADKLKVKLKSKVVVTIQDVDGNMQSIAFRVCGIYKTYNGMYDEANIYVRRSDLLPYTGLPDEAVHEAVLLVKDMETCDSVKPDLAKELPHLHTQSWKEINPSLAMNLMWSDYMCFIMLGIFLFALAFGIVNTMLMVVLERKYELGMLRAIGMTRQQAFRMIMLETLFLTFLGSIVGVIIAILVILLTGSGGIDLSPLIGDLYDDFGYSAIVYPVIGVKMFIQIALLVFVTGLLSAIYPAWKALKTNPLEATKH